MGIHKENNESIENISDPIREKQIIQSNIDTKIIWNTSVNSGINGNSGYLYPVVIGDIIYSIDTDGLLSAVSLIDGNILWNIPIVNFNNKLFFWFLKTQ